MFQSSEEKLVVETKKTTKENERNNDMKEEKFENIESEVKVEGGENDNIDTTNYETGELEKEQNSANVQVEIFDDQMVVIDPPPSETEETGKTSEQDMNAIQEYKLPENVTEKPRNDEEMHLDHIKEEPEAVKVYLNVSDEDGKFIGSKETEQEVKDLCKTLKQINSKEIDNPEKLIDQISEVMERYSPLINQAENTSVGIITKYRIRQGQLLISQKSLVKYGLKKKWTEWFENNYDQRVLRSAQDYMRIAEVPNSIRYAVFGKERLIQIIKQIGKTSADDPIGAFLKGHGIKFDPSLELNDEDIKFQTDLAVAKSQLKEKGLVGIPDEKVESLVWAKRNLTPALLNQIKLAKETGADLTEYINKIIAGKKPARIETSQTKADSYKKTLSKFLDMTKDAIKDNCYLDSIDKEVYQELKKRILELESKFIVPSDD